MKTNIILQGDCIEELKKLEENSVDAIITDPPYGLEFMGKEWDSFKSKGQGDGWQKAGKPSMKKFKGKNDWHSKPRPAFRGHTLEHWHNMEKHFYEFGIEAIRVLKPGGFMLIMGGTRTYHRMVCGIEDAGFSIRDTIMWLYGSGFPKSLNIGKQFDKMQGNEREVVGEKIRGDVQKAKDKGAGYLSDPANRNNEKQFGYGKETLTKGNSKWEGWGTSLKPSHEDIVVAQKPLNTLNHINILCQLKEYVQDVERSLKLIQVGLREGKIHIVVGNVQIQQGVEKENLMEIGKGEDSKGQMDISQFSLKEVNINLNTILLWKNLLEEISNEMNKSTTLMENEMITDLKILNLLIGQITYQNIIQVEKSQVNGLSANALLVENTLKSVLIKSRLLNITSVQENVISKEKNLNLSPNASPIVVARKPLSEKNVALNVLKWGTGGINIDECRIKYQSKDDMEIRKNLHREENIIDGKVFGGGKYLNVFVVKQNKDKKKYLVGLVLWILECLILEKE